jgi:type II secretory pathway component GspD/PulD (secretin)
MVRDSGDTGVIGGIYDTSRTTTVSGVPLLSDIPILGALFRSTQTVENQTELLIMVTPTIVSGRNNEERMETSATQGNRAREAM